MPSPFSMQDQLTWQASTSNDECVCLDAELLGKGIDGIQGEVALPALDAGEIASRDDELLGESFLRQTARKA